MKVSGISSFNNYGITKNNSVNFGKFKDKETEISVFHIVHANRLDPEATFKRIDKCDYVELYTDDEGEIRLNTDDIRMQRNDLRNTCKVLKQFGSCNSGAKVQKLADIIKTSDERIAENERQKKIYLTDEELKAALAMVRRDREIAEAKLEEHLMWLNS